MSYRNLIQEQDLRNNINKSDVKYYKQKKFQVKPYRFVQLFNAKRST